MTGPPDQIYADDASMCSAQVPAPMQTGKVHGLPALDHLNLMTS